MAADWAPGCDAQPITHYGACSAARRQQAHRALQQVPARLSSQRLTVHWTERSANEPVVPFAVQKHAALPAEQVLGGVGGGGGEGAGEGGGGFRGGLGGGEGGEGGEGGDGGSGGGEGDRELMYWQLEHGPGSC